MKIHDDFIFLTNILYWKEPSESWLDSVGFILRVRADGLSLKHELCIIGICLFIYYYYSFI